MMMKLVDVEDKKTIKKWLFISIINFINKEEDYKIILYFTIFLYNNVEYLNFNLIIIKFYY